MLLNLKGRREVHKKLRLQHKIKLVLPVSREQSSQEMIILVQTNTNYKLLQNVKIQGHQLLIMPILMPGP